MTTDVENDYFDDNNFNWFFYIDDVDYRTG